MYSKSLDMFTYIHTYHLLFKNHIYVIHTYHTYIHTYISYISSVFITGLICLYVCMYVCMYVCVVSKVDVWVLVEEESQCDGWLAEEVLPDADEWRHILLQNGSKMILFVCMYCTYVLYVCTICMYYMYCMYVCGSVCMYVCIYIFHM